MKYLLDTDVVSQYTKPVPNPQVDAWIQRTDDRDLYISFVTYAELWHGVGLLPAGKRRTGLERWIEDELSMQFFNRVAGFSLDVARHYGSLMARAKKNGHNPNAMDALIAATAVANGMVLATLNRKDFEKLGVELVEF
ncbi:MAG: type II toxin-antitoxin system VapC family toxin [Acidobacteriota bacterium]|nr:type II toxin-antitoxin system VapC family toxin [Acidobacteriota bacterium]